MPLVSRDRQGNMGEATRENEIPPVLKIRELSSPNFNERKGEAKPSYLVLHYTGTATGRDAEDHYMNASPDHPGGPVSPHYMVDLDGAVTRFVAEDKRAWHAGVSRWDGLDDLNSLSIGVEIVNPGHEFGYRVFPAQQMLAVAGLCHEIIARNGIRPADVLAHSDIAPDRKADPGELFDWALLARHGIGVWPKAETQDYQESGQWVGNEDLIRAALAEAGYDARVEVPTLVTAFQRHYQPEVFRQGGEAGEAGRETLARLHRLQRLRRA